MKKSGGGCDDMGNGGREEKAEHGREEWEVENGRGQLTADELFGMDN